MSEIWVYNESNNERIYHFKNYGIAFTTFKKQVNIFKTLFIYMYKKHLKFIGKYFNVFYSNRLLFFP